LNNYQVKIMHNLLKHSKLFLSLIAIIIILSAYFYHFSDIPFVRMDEGVLMEAPYRLATQGQFGSPMLENGGNQTHYFHIHPPVYYLGLALTFKQFGFGIFQGRSLSFFFAIISMFLFFQILKETGLINKLPLIFVFILWMTTPLFFVLSKTIRPEILMLLWTCLSYWLLLRWLKYNQNRYVIAGAVINTLMLLTHMYGLPLFFLWLFELLRKRSWKPCMIFIGMFLLPLIPYIIWIMGDSQAFLHQVIADRSEFRVHFINKVFGLLMLLFASKKITLMVLMLFGGLIIMLRNKLSQIQQHLLFVSVLFVSQFFVLPKFNELYFILMLPIILIVWLSLITAKNKKIITTFLILVCVVNISGLIKYIYQYRQFDFKAYQDSLNQYIPNKPNLFVLGPMSLYPIFHQTHFSAHEAFVLPRDFSRLKKVIQKANYIVIENYELDNRMKELIINNKKSITQIISPYYGSEGLSRNNIITIYH